MNMNSNQFLRIDGLELDLAFTGFLPDGLETYLDKETTNLLINCQLWSDIFKSWMNFLRNNQDIECTDIFRKNNFFSMGLNLTDDLSVIQLNEKWRHKKEPTDVLSFPSLDNNMPAPCSQFIELGDIIVSVETALKQAKENDHSLADELRWLVSHGFLHLLGRDHPTSISLDRMLCDQDKLINEIYLS